ncbi:MAG: sulfotransferase [Gammaproteobacteria bacterium]|nr:MAG: sulfotransferase [Gammaproteobacteria bacterium]TND05347.1 MAG: sulfotransferase [Gammaproteobacteria bacterium]
MSQYFLGENLIFIISQPRSGSTLLQRVLAGHPEIQTSAETWMMLHPVYALKDSGIDTEYNAKFSRQGMLEFLTHYTDGEEVHLDAIREWARIIYGNAIAKGGKTYFLDKTPRYFFIIPELYRLFPKAKFIFLIRNPMAVLASELSTYVNGDWKVLGIFRPDLIHAPQYLLDGIQLLGDSAVVIRYEDFVRTPEKSITALCNQLGITYHESMLNYDKTPKPIGSMNDPVGIDQHTRPSAASVDKWRNMSSDPQARHFAISYLDVLGHRVIEALGYSYDEIRDGLEAGKHDTHRGADIFPWDIAIRPQNDWNFREWLTAERFFAIKRKGKIKGRLSALKQGLLHAYRLVKQQLRTRQGIDN